MVDYRALLLPHLAALKRYRWQALAVAWLVCLLGWLFVASLTRSLHRQGADLYRHGDHPRPPDERSRRRSGLRSPGRDDAAHAAVGAQSGRADPDDRPRSYRAQRHRAPEADRRAWQETSPSRPRVPACSRSATPIRSRVCRSGWWIRSCRSSSSRISAIRSRTLRRPGTSSIQADRRL